MNWKKIKKLIGNVLRIFPSLLTMGIMVKVVYAVDLTNMKHVLLLIAFCLIVLVLFLAMHIPCLLTKSDLKEVLEEIKDGN